jgi:hypothetical protein
VLLLAYDLCMFIYVKYLVGCLGARASTEGSQGGRRH